MDKPIPLPVKILGGPALVLIILAVLKFYAGSIWGWPTLTVGLIGAALLAWVRILWPAGFKRRG